MASQSYIGLPPVPSDLKPVTPFLQRAEEVKLQDPIISYWCRRPLILCPPHLSDSSSQAHTTPLRSASVSKHQHLPTGHSSPPFSPPWSPSEPPSAPPTPSTSNPPLPPTSRTLHFASSHPRTTMTVPATRQESQRKSSSPPPHSSNSSKSSRTRPLSNP